jgi:pimeloyl-ACP methyl ester carboxylesterase
MTSAVTLAGLIALTPALNIPLTFWGISPEVKEVDAKADFKPTKTRAIVLIHGLLPRPIRPELAHTPDPHSWQNRTGDLVKTLAEDFDVFGVSYAQTLPADLVPVSQKFRESIAVLNKLGYKDIVLVGHSAGGIIARHFVEMFPDAGVTKLITIATPHLGSGWTNVPSRLWPKSQVPFIESLSEGYRTVATRNAPPLPKNLEVLSIVCKLPRIDSDTMVGVKSQWPTDFQQQGISAIVVRCNHFEAMKNTEVTKAIQTAARDRIVRWKPEDVEKARGLLFGK